MTHIEIKEDGKAYVIEGMPEKPYCADEPYCKEGSLCDCNYESKVDSAPRILCADQEQATERIRQELGVRYSDMKPKPGIYSLPDVEWAYCYGTSTRGIVDMRRRAILKKSLPPDECKSGCGRNECTEGCRWPDVKESPACDYREGCGTVDCTCEKESPKEHKPNFVEIVSEHFNGGSADTATLYDVAKFLEKLYTEYEESNHDPKYWAVLSKRCSKPNNP